MDLNYCVFIGRLGRDPDLKYMANGEAFCGFSLAVGKKWKDKTSGETKEQTTWVRCTVFGKTAELVGQYAKKGSQMRVNGELTVRKYEKDGVEREVTEIRVQDFQLLGAAPTGGAQAAPAAQRQAAPAQRQAPHVDDDIPF